MSTKISQLTSAVDVTANDLIQIVDVEDGVMAPSGTNKKITASLLAKELAKQPLEPGVVISGSSSGDAVRITQTGSGNALVVEDSVNPDSSPFAINGNGQLIIGGTGLTPMSSLRTLTIKTNSDYNEVNNGNIGSERYSNSSSGVIFSQGKARGTWQYPEAVQSGDDLGSFVWRGHDGNQLEFAAFIGSHVDGTPEVGSMPGNLSFYTTPDGSIVSTERMRITSSGNVGIGTSSPIDKLTVNGPIAIFPATSNLYSGSVDEANRTNTYLTFSGSTGQTDFAYLRQIGTGDNDLTIALDLHDDLNDPTGSQAFVIRKVGSATDPDTIQTNFMVTSSGNVGIGTDSPSAKLHISSSEAGWVSGLLLENTTAASRFALATRNDLSSPARFSISNETVFQEYFSLLASNGYVGLGVFNPSYQLQLSTDSAAKPSTSTWTVSSDERLKENIEAADLDICYNAVKSIPLKRYKWKDEIYSEEQVSDRSKIGWIAQDVQEVFPKAVGQHKFVYNQVKDEDGNIVSEESIDDCLSLNSDQLYAAMFGAVQKLMITVEELQDKVVQLESGS